MTEKMQLAAPTLFDAVQLTSVTPMGKVLPGGGVQVTAGVGDPVAGGRG